MINPGRILMLLAIFCIFALFPAFGQQSVKFQGQSYSGQPIRFAQESMSDVMMRASAQKNVAPISKRVVPFRSIKHRNDMKFKSVKPRSASVAAPQSRELLGASVLKSFPGIQDNGQSIPPDTVGAVGPSHIVETLNTEVALYNKDSGEELGKATLQEFWASLGTNNGEPANFPFDPRVLYDPHSGRFFFITMGGVPSPSWILIAASKDSDPTKDFYKYAIDADGGSQVWADYPGLGVDKDNVYVTVNMFTDDFDFAYSSVWIFPKSQLLAGDRAVNPTRIDVNDASAFTLKPATIFGNGTTMYLVNMAGFGGETPYLCLWKVSGNEVEKLGFIGVAPFPNIELPDAAQKDTADKIEVNDDRILDALYRNGYIWATQSVASSDELRTEAAWYKIDPSKANLDEPGETEDQGRVKDANRWYYFPSIAVNSNNDVAMGFTGSSATEFAGCYFTTRKTSDTKGTMRAVTMYKDGEATYFKTFSGQDNRWGDYSATVVDPFDDLTFWTLQEYAATPAQARDNNDRWGTYWAKFKAGSAAGGGGAGGGGGQTNYTGKEDSGCPAGNLTTSRGPSQIAGYFLPFLAFFACLMAFRAIRERRQAS